MEVVQLSKFSGKCDFYDEIEIFGLENILNSKVYVGDNKEPLNLTCRKDCIPYYPYVVTASAKTNGVGTIFLTEKSWVDIESERYGEFGCHNYYRELLKKELEMAENGGIPLD